MRTAVLVTLHDRGTGSVIMHLASSMDAAYDWCESHDSMPRYELEPDNTLQLRSPGTEKRINKWYGLREMPIDGEYKPGN